MNPPGAEGEHDLLTLAELAEHCQSKGLARQKIPEQIELVDALPRNPMGKLLKQELRDAARSETVTGRNWGLGLERNCYRNWAIYGRSNDS